LIRPEMRRFYHAACVGACKPPDGAGLPMWNPCTGFSSRSGMTFFRFFAPSSSNPAEHRSAWTGGSADRSRCPRRELPRWQQQIGSGSKRYAPHHPVLHAHVFGNGPTGRREGIARSGAARSSRETIRSYTEEAHPAVGKPVKALIASGERGTRLPPSRTQGTNTLIPVANKPILSYAIEAAASAGSPRSASW